MLNMILCMIKGASLSLPTLLFTYRHFKFFGLPALTQNIRRGYSVFILVAPRALANLPEDNPQLEISK